MAPRFRPVALRPHLSVGLPFDGTHAPPSLKLVSNFNMPNKLHRDKRSGTRNSATTVAKRFNSATTVAKPFRRPHSVKDVLGAQSPTLTRVAAQSSRQSYWKQWLAAHLPAELTPRLSGVVEREDTLVILAESAAWSARLRYVIQELEGKIKQAQPTIQHVSVRVMPKT
jgi:hypothetical protein